MSVVVLVVLIAAANFAIGFGLATYAGHGPTIDLAGRLPAFWRRGLIRAGQSPPQTNSSQQEAAV